MKPTELFLPGAVIFDFADPSTYNGLTPELAFDSLSRIRRFNGHRPQALTVLEHSILCARLARHDEPGVRLACLLHDVEEAVTGDIPAPLKRTPIFGKASAFLGKLRRDLMDLMVEPGFAERYEHLTESYDKLAFELEIHGTVGHTVNDPNQALAMYRDLLLCYKQQP